MFVILMKADKPACEIRLGCLSLAGIIVYSYHIINKNILPEPLRKNTRPELFPMLLRRWLEERVLPNSDPNLDQTMFEVYLLDSSKYGRMYYYQYIGAFMAYMVSNDDDYWVNPTHTQVLTYGLLDPHWTKGYLCKPAEDLESARKEGGIFQKCLKNL